MMKTKRSTFLLVALSTTLMTAVGAFAQGPPPVAAPPLPISPETKTGGLDPAAILNPHPESWPTYSGDYSGRRYSPLTDLNHNTVKNLTLSFVAKLTGGSNGAIVGGEAPTGAATGAVNVRGVTLLHDGVLYTSAPDNAWAVDARTGKVLWHYYWKTLGGTHIGNRGLGMWHNTLFMETPDDYLVALDAKSGQERWHVPIASFNEQYFSTMSPIVVGDHVLVGSGNDNNMPGYLQSFDPVTGALQWKFYGTPQTADDPALATWKDLYASQHGGGNMWVPGSYDPETRLYIVGTGNPTPSYFAEPRGNKEALWTCALVAIDVDTGKMKWFYQTSPNDTHDWDSTQTPVLADIMFEGKPRKVAMTAARNGYFFVVDRVTGEHLVTSKFSETANWAEEKLNAKGQPVRIPAKDSDVGGALVSLANQGASNWQPPAFSPDSGLFYVPTNESWAVYYKTETDPRGAMGLGGKDEVAVPGGQSFLKAIDPKTGKIAWQVAYENPGNMTGLLATAGKLLFGSDTAGNFVARDVVNGKPLWRANLGTVSAAPQTYMLDGEQQVLVAGGDTLYAFKLVK